MRRASVTGAPVAEQLLRLDAGTSDSARRHLEDVIGVVGVLLEAPQRVCRPARQ